MSCINEKAEFLLTVLRLCMSAIPTYTVKKSQKDKPWITLHLKHLINLRWSAFRVGNIPLYNHYKENVKCGIVNAKRSWALKNCKNPQSAWNIVNEIKGCRARQNLSSIFQAFPSKLDAVNEINRKFTDVFTIDDSQSFTTPTSLLTTEDWCPLSNTEEIYDMLLKLKPSKATGSDNIPTRLYCEAAVYLAEPICHLINTSILNCEVPALWKEARISPVPKTTPADIDALRPISLLSIPAKLLERVVLNSMRSRFLRNIDDFQFAYRPRSSTTCALIYVHKIILDMMDDEESLGAALLSLDFSKAFDTISHNILLNKLVDKGFPDNFIIWMKSYLTGRTQRVCVDNTQSTSRNITSGVPQGSIIGPVLFTFYIADIRDQYYMKYADDMSLFHKISLDVQASLRGLKSTFEKIKEECRQLKLHLNVTKSKLLVFTKKTRRQQELTLLSIQGVESVKQLKLLGVTFSSNLSWESHVRDVVSKCARRMYIIRLVKGLVPTSLLIDIYFCLIRSLLEYCCPVWIGLTDQLRYKLNSVQTRCHRIIHGPCNCSCFPNLDSRRYELAVKLLRNAENFTEHVLHPFVPVRSARSGHFRVPYARSTRSLNSWLFKAILYHNENT